MADEVEVEAHIRVKGLSKEDYRGAKSETPELKTKRLKKEIKDAQKSLDEFLNDLKTNIDSSFNALKYARDNKLKDGDAIHGSNCDNYAPWYECRFHPLGNWIDGRKITKETTDEEIKEIVLESAKFDEDYKKNQLAELNNALKDHLASEDHYFLWLVPEPSVVIKVDSSNCIFTMVNPENQRAENSIYAKDFFELLKNNKLDVEFFCDNLDASYLARKVRINKVYKS